MTPQPADSAANPVVVEVTRGAMVENRHRAAVAVVDAAGAVVLAAGDVERPVYPRSAIKALQALPLVETGAADRFGLGAAELALACASHSGEPVHVETVREWLARIGCSEDDLECGAHLPYNEDAARRLLAGGGRASPLHNNCSGKHAGFLTVARHLGLGTSGYVGYDHPVQQGVLAVLAALTGLDLGAAPRGIDGCGIPVIGIPLRNVALAMALFSAPHDLPARRQEAARRLRRAIAAHPFLIGGSGRFDTRIMEIAGAKAVIKVGAQGVYCGALPDRGLGIALKVDDGAPRAAEAVIGRLLRRFGVLSDADANSLADALEPPVLNHAAVEVGRVRIAAECPF